MFHKLNIDENFNNNLANIFIVNFPRKPKPDDYPAQWVYNYWIL